jgi:hypothetical protein
MRRFTIRILMAVIVFTAIGLAALRNSNDWWAGMMLLVAVFSCGYLAMAIRTCQKTA